ncbi:MAG: alpha-L-rhamnosidase N-terminal domain-containing protein [Acidobacteriaceae bacterium]|nr:alpha-L-rhamnosidase N-terminal domain-containing protein [Acidobacteriaceae bacterium]
MKWITLLFVAAQAFAAESHTVVTHVWRAQWIDVPGTLPQGYGVYHFRRAFELTTKPAQFVVYVSADNRYQLYVNGARVSCGAARGDLTHWRYETVDIASQLHVGRNLLAAVVWNDGPYRAVAQITNQTGFVLEAAEPQNLTVNTGRTWRCVQDGAYSPQPLAADQSTGYYALAANERVDGAKYPWGWEQADFDDSSWAPAHEIDHAAARYARDAHNRWMLVATEIPPEEQKPEQAFTVRKSEGVTVSQGPLRGAIPFGPHTRASVLLDQTYLTTAYPEIAVSGGKGSEINLRYAETLFIRKGSGHERSQKGNRDDVEDRQFYGPADTYLPDGGSDRTYRPLYWRTYRYLRLEVSTADAPLRIEAIRGTFTAFPFDKRAVFEAKNASEDREIQQILSTGWRTARLCAHETYMDCPFYEQLQYAGDARIQMMISLYMTGDSRLMKNGIALLNSSRTAEGATYSRAPSYLQQYIPPFSLWWIGMVRDYWMYVDDPDFVKSMLPGVRAVLSFYQSYQKPNGSLQKMPWWNFVDWVRDWANGEPPADPDGSSAAALDLQLLLAYQWATELESALGSKALAGEYREAADKLAHTVVAMDWDAGRGLFADQPTHRSYSQQVNTLAVLAHITRGEQARTVVEKMISDPSLAQSSIYFRAYTNATLREVGLGDRYLEMLGPWRSMLGQGLTTWAEWDGADTRSDCHAWGASPNYEFLRTVAGIESAAPGFKRVRIAPNVGNLQRITASMPHPRGEIQVDLRKRGDGLAADVELPEGIEGEFEWKGRRTALHGGRNEISY